MIQLYQSWAYNQRTLYPTLETAAGSHPLLLYSQKPGTANILDDHQLLNE